MKGINWLPDSISYLPTNTYEVSALSPAAAVVLFEAGLHGGTDRKPLPLAQLADTEPLAESPLGRFMRITPQELITELTGSSTFVASQWPTASG